MIIPEDLLCIVKENYFRTKDLIGKCKNIILVFYQKIGKGSFGLVYKAEWMGIKVAVKVLDFDEMNEEDCSSYLEEVALLSTLNHPNVVKFIGASLFPPNLFIVLKYASRGSLYHYLEKDREKKFLTLSNRLDIAVGTCRGLMYLHTQEPPILHRDLKSLNVLITKHHHAKITDFGLSKQKSSEYNTKIGTLQWLPPEVVGETEVSYTEASDIYSLGVVLWEIITSNLPYEGKSPLQIMRMISMGDQLKIPKEAPLIYQQILALCWEMNPQKRPDIISILKNLIKIAKENTQKLDEKKRGIVVK